MAWHYLRGNKSCAGPGAVVVVDTETLPTEVEGERPYAEHRFRLGCATYWRTEGGKQTRRDELDFSSTEQFWEWLEQKLQPRIPTWLFTHNLGFDLAILGFFQLLDDEIYRLYPEPEFPDVDDSYSKPNWKRGGLFVDDDPPTIIISHHRNGASLKCVDTLNYWRTSLAAMGKAAGVPKLSMPDFAVSDAEWFRYCRQDVLVLERCVLGLVNWVREMDLGKFRFSAPSQAMAAFRHRFMREKIVLHDEPQVKLLERDAYFGGRVQLFYRGVIAEGPEGDKISLRDKPLLKDGKPLGPVFQLDVTSLYPSVMKSYRYPKRLTDWRILDEPTSQSFPDFGECACAWVRIENDAEEFPVRSRDGTVYCRGAYWTALCGPELSYAHAVGCITHWLCYAVYEIVDLFSEYVDEFWTFRRTFRDSGRELESGLCKLMLNSLYGKFGQRNSKWEDRPDLYPVEPWSKWTRGERGDPFYKEYRSLGSLVQERVEIGEHPQAFPAIAGFVTAAGRMRMRELRKIAGEENCYYQAVDALYTNTAGYLRLDRAGEVADKQLGKLNLEKVAASAEFRGLNNYTLGEKHVIGSIKAKAVKQEDGSYKQDHFESLASILQREQNATVRVYPAVKRLQNLYRRGTVDQFGWVTPLTLSGDATTPNRAVLPQLLPKGGNACSETCS